MLTAICRLSARPLSKASTSSTFSALYSTVTGLTRTTWRTSGPAPRLLAENTVTSAASHPSPSHSRPPRHTPARTPTPHQIKTHKAAIKEAFPGGWAPPRKLSRAAMDGLRWLHAQDPQTCTTPVLAEKFRISPEAVRRILRSKWEPTKEQRERLLQKERVHRDGWIAQKRREERETQIRTLGERAMARGQKEEARHVVERGDEERRSRRPRGVNRNDKLSFT